ncbi:hypothetical protein TNCV_705151 [Trichonephila clavipes]|nr:hypothetical protein TNCV_705151 [Trichonephila clavipes]
MLPIRLAAPIEAESLLVVKYELPLFLSRKSHTCSMEMNPEIVPAIHTFNILTPLRAVRQFLRVDMVHCRREKLQTHSESKIAHMEEESRYNNGSRRLNLREDVKVCTTTKHDASPNENTATSIPVPFNDVRGMIAASPALSG